MAEPGRPRLLDDAKRREICALIVSGYSLVAAADYVGCSRRTIKRELARNPEFAERFRRAKLAGELEPLGTIRSAARTNWRAAAWYLERTNPQRFGRRNPVLIRPEEVQQTINSVLLEILEEIKQEPRRGRIMQKLFAVSGQMEDVVDYHEKYIGSTKPVSQDNLPSIPGMTSEEIADLVELLEDEQADE